LTCNFSVSLVTPVFVGTVHAKTTGLVSLADYFKNLSADDGEGKLSGEGSDCDWDTKGFTYIIYINSDMVYWVSKWLSKTIL